MSNEIKDGGPAECAAENYFSYDPCYGFELHTSADEAKKRAQNAVSAYRDDASEGWSEEVDGVCWGEVRQYAAERDTTAETGQGFETCDYQMADAKSAVDASEIERQSARIAELEAALAGRHVGDGSAGAIADALAAECRAKKRVAELETAMAAAKHDAAECRRVMRATMGQTPLCFVRMLDGEIDWSEDCLSPTDGLDCYDPDDGYSVQKLFAAPVPPTPRRLTNAEIGKLVSANGTGGWQTSSDMAHFANALMDALGAQDAPSGINAMEFRAFLDLLMCSDPWPVASDSRAFDTHQQMLDVANRLAADRGYNGWIDAYHRHEG